MTARTGNFQDLGGDPIVRPPAPPPSETFSQYVARQTQTVSETIPYGGRGRVPLPGEAGYVPPTAPPPPSSGGGGFPPPVVPPVVPPPVVTPAAVLNLEGATLITVGSGTNRRYYAEWLVYGVLIRHEIGDQTDLEGLGPQPWPATVTLTETEFANRDGLDVGLVDERLGITESYQATTDRQLRMFGQEDLPAWQRNDPQTMLTLMTAANEGWSEGRTLNAVVKLEAFQVAHPKFNEVTGRHLPGGATTAEKLAWYTEARDQLRNSVRTYRGAEADVSNETIADILARGWDPEEAEDLLIGEAVVRQMTGTADQLNAILAFQGYDIQVTEDNLLDLILEGETDRTPFAMQELINDAIRAQAFQTQGVNLSPELASALGTGESFETMDPDQARQLAQQVATNVFRYGLELQAEREGLTRDDLITAMVNGTNETAVLEKLAKFSRRRQISAQGLGTPAYVGQEGRLIAPSFSGL